MIDSGVDWAPVLAGAQGRSADFLDAADKASSRQHGTAVASLIVGQQDFGLLPRADLYASEIFGVDSDGMPLASATSFAAALNWLLVSKVAIVNVGLSGPPDRLMEIAVARAMERGMHLVAAVGNDGMADSPRYPAAYPGVIGVTAVDARGDALPRANRGASVMLAAPGVDLWIPGQPGNVDLLATGTSFAAPYVTAILAMDGNDPQAMLDRARDLGVPGPDPVFGRGMVQAPQACE
jgi:subtilisin family serine protease